jgi:hypothetical protein
LNGCTEVAEARDASEARCSTGSYAIGSCAAAAAARSSFGSGK